MYLVFCHSHNYFSNGYLLVLSKATSELIRAIKRAQTLAKERKRREKAKTKVTIWVDGHVEQQKRKAARALEKKENRAKPNGKRYMPGLGNQSDSSETYDSDSEDSIPEVVWSPKKPQGLQGPHNPNPVQQLRPFPSPKKRYMRESRFNSDPPPNSARDLQRSIRDRMRNANPGDDKQVPKERCTCPDGKCKWLGECLSPK